MLLFDFFCFVGFVMLFVVIIIGVGFVGIGMVVVL